ncbi:serine O-acetyltransferase EpsC [Pontimicrobium sp. SW4]|uniref:Serine O-acetyltransferase EpsC n=1 Tax=Pontimicrobium sp. SW4 TaxID=3153519 RepID=A0AAU7BRC0_9FLAO
MKYYNIYVKDAIEAFTKKLFYVLFLNDQLRKEELPKIRQQFLDIAEQLQISNAEGYWNDFQEMFVTIRKRLDLDALATEQNDPAAKSIDEVYLAYPGFHAIAIYRLSNQLYKQGVPLIPRMMSEYVHGVTGTDIHPGATIGDSFFIDHATGIVIGETSIIKNNVKIYQGVTLGGIQIKKSLASTKRHPTIEDNVVIYANATILGGDIVIGKNSIIGANVWITTSIPENSLVTNQLENKITTRKK